MAPPAKPVESFTRKMLSKCSAFSITLERAVETTLPSPQLRRREQDCSGWIPFFIFTSNFRQGKKKKKVSNGDKNNKLSVACFSDKNVSLKKTGQRDK